MKRIIIGIIIPQLVLSLAFLSSTTAQTNESLEDGYIESHSDLNGLEVLFIVRPQYINEHGTEATMYQTDEVNTSSFRGGSALKKINLNNKEVITLLSAPDGIIRNIELGYDAKKILFSMRNSIDDDYHIYEMNVDGTGIKQITFGSNLTDIQPIYLPDGKIVFSSTRDPKYVPCQRHLMANLFKMDGDGANIHQLGYNTQFEGRASMMPDGRILYTRWEYVDKHFAPAYGLWTVNPDGTNHTVFYGVYSWQPSAICDARMIPGTNKFVSIFTAVHEMAWGAMVIADPSIGDDGLKPIVRSWPPDISPYMSEWDSDTWVGAAYDSFNKIKVKYQNPYPLSEELFLCARQIEEKSHTGIFLLDDKGRELLLYEESPGCFEPVPVVQRQRPPIIPSKMDFKKENGYFYVQDTYEGVKMKDVHRGEIKYLRVVEAPAKRSYIPYGVGDWAASDAGDSHHPAAVNWHHYNNKKILGTVEIEDDGSVYFEAPSGKFIYFQLLDKDRKMIHSMRSGTMLQPGEVKGCVGCHENKRSAAPVNAGQMLAMKKPPQQLEGWYGEAREFGYNAEVQPVLDKYCIRCHDYGKEAGHYNLSGDKGIVFNQSYTNLMRRTKGEWKMKKRGESKQLVDAIGSGPVKEVPPYSWGSTQSEIVDMLEKNHGGVELDSESFERIVTWIDLNASYYPVQETYYRNNTVGRSPLNHNDLLKLGQLILKQPGGNSLGWDKVKDYFNKPISTIMLEQGEPVNFTRPEMSLCLQIFESKESEDYKEALELIRKGKRNLERNPRADMAGYRPCEFDQAKLDMVGQRMENEKMSREAILDNRKFYETSKE